jgi:hypothetical protein
MVVPPDEFRVGGRLTRLLSHRLPRVTVVRQVNQRPSLSGGNDARTADLSAILSNRGISFPAVLARGVEARAQRRSTHDAESSDCILGERRQCPSATQARAESSSS